MEVTRYPFGGNIVNPTWIVIPTLNEMRNLIELVPQILAIKSDVQLVFVDDSSDDGTSDWLRSTSKADSRIVLLQGDCKGYGAAIKKGMKFALEQGGARIVTMDGDLSHDASEIGHLIEAGGDLVLGSRYTTGGAIEGWRLRRRITSRVANRIARFSLGATWRDVTTGFRAYSGELASQILHRSKAEGYQFLVEAVQIAMDYGMTIVEVPITFRERRWGTSKLSGYSEVPRFLSFIIARTRLKHFVLVTGSAALISLLLLIMLTDGVGLSYLTAGLFAIEGAILYSFIANDLWTFRHRNPDRRLRRFLRYNAIALTGLVINLVILFVLTEFWDLVYILSHAYGMGFAFSWKYILPSLLTWGS